jgi:hypothetical protein
MTVTAVTIPTPPNSNLDRAMFVWIPQVGGASDPLSSDTNMQNLLNWCTNNGINVLFLDIWVYLGGGNFSTTHAQTFQKFIHFAHASGIRVLALGGNTDWGHNQQWVMANVVKNIAQYQAYCANNSTNTEGGFDGVILDAEYWTVNGYTSTEPTGMCDLMKAMRSVLQLPVGFAPTQWLTDPLSAALSFTYDGYTGLEGYHLMRHADFCVIQAYSNSATTQTSMLQNWFNYASQSGFNLGLYCASLTDTGQGSASYWTGSAGAKATMETAHTTISGNFTASPNTNASFRGQAIEQYSSYKNMT